MATDFSGIFSELLQDMIFSWLILFSSYNNKKMIVKVRLQASKSISVTSKFPS